MIAPSRSTSWVYRSSYDGSPNCGDFAACVVLDSGRRAVFVGDVAGRGERASRAARMLETYVSSLVLQNVAPAVVLELTDRFFARGIREEAIPFASLFVAVSDDLAGCISYASAGHETALLFSDANAHVHLASTGPLLGLDLGTGANFAQRTFPLDDERLLVVVTDGITDARPPGRAGSFFGSAGVVRAVAGARRERTNPARAVHRAAATHAQRQLGDDASVLVSALGPAVAARAAC